MITRSQMRRQLRAKGGIMNAVPRQKYGIGDFVRKLIPNELADIAVKAAPFVAPFNPGIAAAMRGIGRFDQRGSISDALKQGLGTYGFGKAAGYLGGAQSDGGIFGGQTFSKEGFKSGPVGRLFQKPTVDPKSSGFQGAKETSQQIATGGTKPLGIPQIRDATGLFKDVPILKDLPSLVQQQILVGGVTSAGTYIYQKFLADEPPQEEGETMEEYLARRKVNVGKKMRSYFDNYFKFDKEYSSLDDAGKDAFVARYNMMSGGRAGYQTGGITMANTLAENMRRNLANQQAVSQQFQAARSRLPGYVAPQRIAAPTPTPVQEGSLGPIGIPERPGLFPQPPSMPITQPMEPPKKIIQPEERVVTKPIDIVDFYEEVTQPGGPADDMMFTKQPVAPDPNTPIEEFIDGPVATLPRMTMPGGPEAEIGLAQPTYNDPLPYDQLMAGFEEYKKNNPVGGGTMALIPVTLPNGEQFTFRNGGEAAAFAQYLESIGQAPYQKRAQPIESIGGGLSKLAGGGMPMGEPRVNQGGITELDYRAKGGFVPVGIKEKADDVPAMLSKNEFVFTADAVRGAGNGSVEKGAQKMYDTMKNLERRVT